MTIASEVQALKEQLRFLGTKCFELEGRIIRLEEQNLPREVTQQEVEEFKESLAKPKLTMKRKD